ncbi:12429_t:CDS:2 [Dentiscutata heterogama]|uniref:12429_t:CDS:1 n=1 Tax=Dentiscutata heterogama TaxID=1316150 RepID=A0ACA9L9X8_9GLOM|nr:12429_t:CDS:2 [Dentiscutata heterogama]
MSTREQDDHVEIKVEEFGDQEHKRQNFSHGHEIKLVCSPNLKYIATLSEKDESILIWPVLDNKQYLDANKSFKISELDTNEDGESVFKLEELSDDALIVLISETSCIMYDTNREEYVEIPHFNEQVLQTSEIYVSFFKNGYFAFIFESKLYLYSVITKDSKTCLQCKNIFGFNIELNQCTLSRDGKLLIGNGFFKSQWDINSEKFEIQYPDATDLIFNKYGNLLAVWHNRDLTLKIYSAKTGIKILSRKIKMNYKNQDNEYFQINFLNLSERLLISHFTNSKMQNYLTDPYSENSENSEENTTIELELYDELNSKFVGFVPKGIFENKIIGIANRKVLIYDLFQGHFQNYLREQTEDKSNIHFLSIMKEILEKIEEAESDISHTFKVDTELKGQIKGEHMNLVNWEYDENSDGKMELSAKKGNINLAKLNVTDIFVEKDSLNSLNILAFKLLTNDELMIITKWYHLSIREFTIIVALDNDKSIRIKYFFDTNYLKKLLKVYKDLLEKRNMDIEMDKDLLKIYKDLLKVYKDLLEKCKMDSDSEMDKDLLKCKIVSEKLFSVDYFKFIFKNFGFGFFDQDNTLSKLIEDHINDTSFFALYAQNLLEAAISERRIDLVNQVFDKCMKLIINDPAEINVLKIISSLSIKLYETYPDYFNRFISQTSLLLSPNHIFREPIVYTSDPHLHPHTAEPYMFKLKKELVDKQFDVPAIHFVVPLSGFSSYDTDFSFWNEIFGRTKSNGFVEIQTPELYSSWSGEALLNFKWNTFGKYYYYLDWAIFTLFLMTFSFAVTENGYISESVQEILLWTSIILGLFLLMYIELRQLIFNWKRYIFNLWNCFESKNMSSTDVNTDLYASFDTSLLAVFLLMTGDNSSLSTWDYHTNRVLVLLMVTFSFFTVIYLLNLFIGLLSNAIEEYNNRAEYLIQKAEIVAVIELFWLFPKQRRWQHWFPEYVCYTAYRDKVHKKIIEVNNDEDLTEDQKPVISNELLKLAGINIKSEESKQEEANLKLDNNIIKKLLELVNEDKETE